MKFKCVSTHAEDLASGQVLAPGEYADLDDAAQRDPHNKRLIEEGILIDASEPTQQQSDEESDEQPKAKTTRKAKGGGES